MLGRPHFGLPLRQAFRDTKSTSRYMHTRSWRRPLRYGDQQQLPWSQRRYAGTFAGNAQQLFRAHPFSTTLATLAIVLGSFSLLYANYFYQTYILRAFHKFPEPVAQKLRRALYYTNYDVQPGEALKYYKEAIQVAQEIGMDMFSDEIIGVRIQVAALMEKIGQWHRAIEVLERLREDNMLWLDRFGTLEENKRQRTSVLGKTIGISVKLGELYGHPAIYDRDLAEERTVWAVEAGLKEQQRRQAEHIKVEDEGEWMSQEEIGASLEALAHTYEASDQHYLAAPLFLQALSLYPTRDCHSVVLMNNLASSLAQQSPRAARAAQAYAASQNINERPVGPAATRESMIENAKVWAQKALDVAAEIRPPIRTEECDVGCVVATHNLGEFAEMSKDIAGARRRYEEALSLAKAIGFEEGAQNSSARLKQLP